VSTPDPLAARLAASRDPTVAYRARTRLLDEPESSPAVAGLRESIAASPRAVALLSGREPDGTIRANPYRKWQGPHWTLYSLALISYPAGDAALDPLRDQVYDWLLSRDHLRPPRTLVILGQEDRVRRCASQEGNAIWYSLVLGIDDERTGIFADRLIGWQWPDGGWNCDRRPGARTSSVQETALPLRALWMYGKLRDRPDAVAAAGRAAEFLLRRRLLWRERDGSPIRPDWGGDATRIHYPIQFYDPLFALEVMADVESLGDRRCDDALALLASKRLADGGFPLEERNCHTTNEIASRGSRADWGPGGSSRCNPLVTVSALAVLQQAGRAATEGRATGAGGPGVRRTVAREAGARGVRWPSR
jgi:hypothetical protein